MSRPFTKGPRRRWRVHFRANACPRWKGTGGRLCHALGRTREISESGLSVEVPEFIPVLTYVRVRLDGIGFEACGMVRHTSRQGIIGIEFSPGLIRRPPGLEIHLLACAGNGKAAETTGKDGPLPSSKNALTTHVEELLEGTPGNSPEENSRTAATTVQEVQKLRTAVASLPHAIDALTQAGRGVYALLSELEGKLVAVEQSLKDQQELMARQTAEAAGRASELNSRLDALDRKLQAQTEETLQLRTACSKLESSVPSLERRLDSQAEAIRTFNSGVQRFQVRLVQKIREVADEFEQAEPPPEA